MIETSGAQHRAIYADSMAYSAHPHAIVTGRDWLVVFNLAPRRRFTMHPPEDPFYRNALMRSEDEGETWTAPEIVPDFTRSGTECAGLTLAGDGSVLLNQYQFRWLPLGLARSSTDQTGFTWPDQFLAAWRSSPEHDTVAATRNAPEQTAPWVRSHGETLVHRSVDGGRSFGATSVVPTAPFAGGYGMRGGIVLPGGRIILPLCDVPHYARIFSVVSDDGGCTWNRPASVAGRQGAEFEEPAPLHLGDGRVLMVLRENVSRQLHAVRSEDGGETWSAPEPIPVTGYPAHLLRLADGRILMTFGWRLPEHEIRAVVSRDEGRSWDIDRTICIRAGLPSRNLGYPVTLPRRDGQLTTIYYGETTDGTTAIQATTWQIT